MIRTMSQKRLNNVMVLHAHNNQLFSNFQNVTANCEAFFGNFASTETCLLLVYCSTHAYCYLNSNAILYIIQT